MTLHASWVHGNTVRAEWVGDTLRNVRAERWDGNVGDVGWSDIVGLPRGWGMTFRGRRSETTGIGGSRTTGPFDPANPFEHSLKGYWFHFAIPTPVVTGGRFASLLRVFVLWEASAAVHPVAVHIYDGVMRHETLAINHGARGRNGAGGHADLIDGETKFDLPSPRQLFWGVGVSVGVAFAEDGEITFSAAGADFDI